jgi:hypothetical protein
METQITFYDWLMLAAFAAFMLMMIAWMYAAIQNATQYPDDFEDEYWDEVKEKCRKDRKHES